MRHDWMRELINQTGKTDEDFKRDAQTKLGLELFPELSDLPVLNQSNTKTITGTHPDLYFTPFKQCLRSKSFVK